MGTTDGATCSTKETAHRYTIALAALARTANARLALRQTGIDRTWVHRRRKADPEFAAAWQAALQTGREALAASHALAQPAPSSAQPADCAEIAVPAETMLVGSSGKGTLRLQRELPRSFGTRKRARFLAALRMTANISESARLAGVSKCGAYKAYRADAPFRAAWDAALAEGRVHLEMSLIGAARQMFEPSDELAGDAIEPPAITGMDAWTAVQLLRLHGPHDGKGCKRNRHVKPADRDSTIREIIAKVAAVKAARELAREAGERPQVRPC